MATSALLSACVVSPLLKNKKLQELREQVSAACIHHQPSQRYTYLRALLFINPHTDTIFTIDYGVSFGCPSKHYITLNLKLRINPAATTKLNSI